MERATRGWMRRIAAACVLASIAAAAAAAAEIVYADGRRAEVADPKQDSQGRWMATREGRRTPLTPGEVVAIVDDAGRETVTIPPVAKGPDAPEAAAALAAVADPSGAPPHVAAEKLAACPTQHVHDALVELARDAKKEVRSRGVAALVRLRTREGVVAATAAVLAEKDAALRREMAGWLFASQEIFRRCDVADAVRKGLEDKDAGVRIAFASLSPRDTALAISVLRADGLKSGDHHVRESAAEELAERRDGSGESVLIGMLARTRLPGIDDPALAERMLVEEQVRVARLLGRVCTDPGIAALKKAAKSSKHEAVRRAAQSALDAAAAATK